jgi:hypothetical protein
MMPRHLALACLPLCVVLKVAAQIPAQSPAPGDAQKMVTVNAWVSDTGKAQMSAATGTVWDGGGHYQTVKLRYWFYPDGGLDQGPILPGPSDFVILGQAAPTLCSSSFVCSSYDGGLDPALATSSGCFCADNSGTCLATNPSGVAGQVAPKGITLGTGYAWTSPTGAGCIAKACQDLWTNLPDGGADSSWPAACPLQ